MAITKSAKKALRQSLKRRARNLQKKNKIKNLIKQVKNLVSQKKVKEDKSSSSTLRYARGVKEDKSSFPASLSRDESSAIEEAKALLPQVYKLLDKAAKTGLIKKNTAARKKARITKLVSRI